MNVSHQMKEQNMEELSRTEYSARNTTVAMLARVVAILLGFCTRVVFTHTLSEEYVGINGLFTDILNVLALSELGVGTAITYALYKPIAEKDIEKQKSLMKLYQKFYRIIAAVVLVAGLLVIPFMDVLIKNQPKVDHLIFIYLMYLANSVISYLLIYKRTLIDAHQLSYIGVLYQTIFLVIQNIAQIVLLVTTKNFILFVSMLMLCTLFNNICISRKADKLYPYLKDKNVQPLQTEEKQGIYQNIKAMLMHKVGTVVVNNTDNLLLSSLVGIVSVGMYSNYYLVIGSIRQVLNQMFQGITASVGNLGVEESKERVKRIFDAAFFIGQWLFGFAVICLYELLGPFVEMSFGEQYVFPKEVTFVLCLNFYFTGMRQATLVFRDSLGLFWYDRYKSLVEAVINLVVSLILGYYWGIIGIFLGTLISTLTTSMWVEPYMLYKHRLQAPVRFYFIKYVFYVLIMFGAWYATDFVCGFVQGDALQQCVLRLGICLVIPNLIFLVLYARMKEFKFLWKKAQGIWNSLFGNAKKQNHTVKLTEAEQNLLKLLRESLKENPAEVENIRMDENAWEEMISMAEKHSVLSLLYDVLEKQKNMPASIWKRTEQLAKKITLQQYHLLFLSKYLVELLEKNDIQTVVMKGVTIGAYYPTPELRKSGDVDLLLLNPDEIEKVEKILQENGFWVKEAQLALHHVTIGSKEGIDIELHTLLAEPFDNEKTNNYLKSLFAECQEGILRKNIMGIELPVLSKPYFAFELMLHMLQHFLRSGFGIKLLCDWVVFWREKMTPKEQEKYLELVDKAGIKGFSEMITQVCVQYLGLDEKMVAWMDCAPGYSVDVFMLDILEAEEFGKSDVNRMVVMRGTGIFDYIREFHHQMRLNFPKAGKCFLLWPVLWMITLVRFLRNNRKLRKVSTGEILKEAKRRSGLMKQLKLFR